MIYTENSPRWDKFHLCFQEFNENTLKIYFENVSTEITYLIKEHRIYIFKFEPVGCHNISLTDKKCLFSQYVKMYLV